MTPPGLPLVKAQRSFLSGIRPSKEQHGPKVKVTEGFEYIRRNLKNKHDLKRAGVKKNVRPCICLYIDSIFTWIVTRPCGITACPYVHILLKCFNRILFKIIYFVYIYLH
jgi:hypothetical protein